MSGVRQVVAIRPYREDDETAVVELLNVALGMGPGGARLPEFFRWKHLENPFGRSFMLLAEAEERIIGLRAFMRWEFRAGDRRIRAVRAVDTATHPDHQRRGVFAQLTREALQALRGEVEFVFNTPNEKSLPGYLKMGWRTVEIVHPSIRVRRPLRFVRRLRSLRSLDDSGGDPPSVEAERAAHALGDDASLSSLLEAAGQSECLHTSRDVAYLRWRYGAAPLLDYRAVRLEVAGSLRGLALFRVRPRGALWEAAIAELIFPRGDGGTAGRLIAEIVRSAPVDHLTCLFPSGSTAARAARRRGFLRAPVGPSFVVNQLGEGLRPDPTRIESWCLCLGDMEVF